MLTRRKRSGARPTKRRATRSLPRQRDVWNRVLVALLEAGKPLRAIEVAQLARTNDRSTRVYLLQMADLRLVFFDGDRTLRTWWLSAAGRRAALSVAA
jgi:hypothetical protein